MTKGTVLFLSLWVSLAGLVPCGYSEEKEKPKEKTTAEQVNVHILQGGQLAQKGELKKAIEEYKEALKLDAKNVGAHLALGLVYARMGDFDEALSHIQTGSIESPSFVSFYNLGLIYSARKEYEKALAAFDKALEFSSWSYIAQYQKGLVYSNMKDHSKAVEAYTQAIKMNPNFMDPYISLGGAYYRLGQREMALKQVQEIRKIGRNDLADSLEKWIKQQDLAAGKV